MCGLDEVKDTKNEHSSRTTRHATYELHLRSPDNIKRLILTRRIERPWAPQHTSAKLKSTVVISGLDASSPSPSVACA